MDITAERITTAEGVGGYLAYPSGQKSPAVLVHFEIFGVNGHIEDVCRRIAGAGYAALAPDYYHRLETKIAPYSDLKGAFKLAGTLKDEEMMADAGSCIGYLRSKDLLRDPEARELHTGQALQVKLGLALIAPPSLLVVNLANPGFSVGRIRCGHANLAADPLNALELTDLVHDQALGIPNAAARLQRCLVLAFENVGFVLVGLGELRERFIAVSMKRPIAVL